MKRILKLHEQKDSKKTIHNASLLFNNIKSIDIDYDQENVLVFYLNTKNKLLNCEILFKGAMNACILDPKIIFRKSIMNRATSIIVAHNHPSGELTPSEEDIMVAKVLKKLGELMDLKVLDNIIFNEKEYYSLNKKIISSRQDL